jgi:phosphosulfolactate synthase (CoM biosynthesis protein A)
MGEDGRDGADFGRGAPRLPPSGRGLTEIRVPPHAPLALGYVEDALEGLASCPDILALAGGAASIVPRREARRLTELCHARGVRVGTGRCLEYVVTLGATAVDRWLGEARDLGFDVVDVSAGFLEVGDDELAKLTEKVAALGLEPKVELSVDAAEDADATTLAGLVARARRHLDAGAVLLALDAVGAAERTRALPADVVLHLHQHVGREHVMVEAPDLGTMALYVRGFGDDVNLAVDHALGLDLAAMRAGLFGSVGVWRRRHRRPPPGALGF